MSHPYEDLPAWAYWRTAVSNLNPLETTDLWHPKFALLPTDQVVTFGSCFAQHISRALVRTGFSWFDSEPGPQNISEALRKDYNYGIFSARTGNIYTAKALLQWLQWAEGSSPPPDDVWERDGRYYDPLRPAIEPKGFASANEVYESRALTLAALRACMSECDIFIFTLGLTEAWENARDGYTYATCPGTNAGEFDPELHLFKNYSYPEVHAHLEAALAILRKHNPDVKVLLTVSPVPLTATASRNHVIVSSTYSKSVLRAVAGVMTDTYAHIDYFPSYEIITAPNFRGMFYSPNNRTVSPKGVDFVMQHFTAMLPATNRMPPGEVAEIVDEVVETALSQDDLKCEEAVLDAFAPES